MIISRAFAAHGITDTGSSGGGNALLIILAVAITFVIGYVAFKKLQNRKQNREKDIDS